MVLENNLQSVSVKYIAPEHLLFQKQSFSSDIKSAIINMTLPITLRPWRTTSPGLSSSIFSSTNDRLNNTEQQIQMLQRTIFPCQTEQTHAYGGLAASLLPHWFARNHQPDDTKRFSAGAPPTTTTMTAVRERYITDFWTTNNRELFVTEIIVRVSRPGKVVHRHRCPHQEFQAFYLIR